MMTCREFEDFIVDYEDGALPRSKRFVFELHLATCSDCRRYHGAYRGSIALSKAVFQKSDETMSAEVPEDLVNAILYARGQKP